MCTFGKRRFFSNSHLLVCEKQHSKSSEDKVVKFTWRLETCRPTEELQSPVYMFQSVQQNRRFTAPIDSIIQIFLLVFFKTKKDQYPSLIKRAAEEQSFSNHVNPLSGRAISSKEIINWFGHYSTIVTLNKIILQYQSDFDIYNRWHVNDREWRRSLK